MPHRPFWRLTAAVVICSASTFSYADVFIDKVPDSLSDAEVSDAIAAGFIGRKWVIEDQSPGSVAATIKHRRYDCDLVISREQSELTSDGSCTVSRPAPGPGNRTIRSSTDVPNDWLGYLRKDIQAELMRLSLARASEQHNEPTAKDRLLELQSLLDAGLISDVEFSEARQRIIDNI